MRLRDLLGDVDVLTLVGDPHVEVRAIAHDSRHVRRGALFCCVRGAHADGHRFAGAAVEAGAVALLVEESVAVRVTQARVESVRRALGPVSARFHGDPSRTLRVLGVTGTNGKTTVTYLVEAIARAAGEAVGVVGTLGARGGPTRPTGFTTPEAPDLQELLAEMRVAGVQTVAMEVSSHALAQFRVDGTRFAAVAFTNLGREHLDLHGTLEKYFEAKCRLFTPRFTGAAAISVDDEHGRVLVARARAEGLDVLTFGLGRDAPGPGPDVAAGAVQVGPDGARFTLHTPVGSTPVRTRLIGRFNVANALGASALAFAGGYTLDAVSEGLGAPVIVPGRMERVDGGGPVCVLVDYAHTPDALEQVMAEARALVGPGRVIVVFGCGGDRDRGKRPLMGVAVGRGADFVVLTSDNPRDEDPAAIARDATEGLDAVGATYTVELDRRAAIGAALGHARPGDVVIIAGKGHETVQTTAGVTVPFDDRVVARELLEASCG